VAKGPALMDLQLSEDPDALLVDQAQALDAALRDVAPSSRSTPVIPDSGVAPKITTAFPDTRRLRRGSR
jgi:hypothetical protein